MNTRHKHPDVKEKVVCRESPDYSPCVSNNKLMSFVNFIDSRRLLRVTTKAQDLPFSTYAPRGEGWGQASYTFPLRITCKRGWVGPDSM